MVESSGSLLISVSYCFLISILIFFSAIILCSYSNKKNKAEEVRNKKKKPKSKGPKIHRQVEKPKETEETKSTADYEQIVKKVSIAPTAVKDLPEYVRIRGYQTLAAAPHDMNSTIMKKKQPENTKQSLGYNIFAVSHLKKFEDKIVAAKTSDKRSNLAISSNIGQPSKKDVQPKFEEKTKKVANRVSGKGDRQQKVNKEKTQVPEMLKALMAEESPTFPNTLHVKDHDKAPPQVVTSMRIIDEVGETEKRPPFMISSNKHRIPSPVSKTETFHTVPLAPPIPGGHRSKRQDEHSEERNTDTKSSLSDDKRKPRNSKIIDAKFIHKCHHAKEDLEADLNMAVYLKGNADYGKHGIKDQDYSSDNDKRHNWNKIYKQAPHHDTNHAEHDKNKNDDRTRSVWVESK